MFSIGTVATHFVPVELIDMRRRSTNRAGLAVLLAIDFYRGTGWFGAPIVAIGAAMGALGMHLFRDLRN